MVLTIATATPALAAKKQTETAPSFDDCYRLGMDRGVHLENGEMPGFVDACMAGNVPFGGEGPESAARRLPTN
jgi:hypothetical protein